MSKQSKCRQRGALKVAQNRSARRQANEGLREILQSLPEEVEHPSEWQLSDREDARALKTDRFE